ncbi:unnamed protein product [Ectocarpus sp. 4 AP-2014]
MEVSGKILRRQKILLCLLAFCFFPLFLFFSSVRSAACSKARERLSSCFVSTHKGGFVVFASRTYTHGRARVQFPVHCPSAPRSSMYAAQTPQTSHYTYISRFAPWEA